MDRETVDTASGLTGVPTQWYCIYYMVHRLGVKKLREIRLKRGMSYRQLVKASGVALSAIQKFEQGGGDPQLSTLGKLSKALNVSVAELIGETKQQKGGR